MIVRSLNVQGLGCFADRVEVGPFGPGLNIVFGPNGAGKSTLSRAITTAFLDGHRVKATEMKALRSWGRRLTPQIGADFEHDNRIYRIEKRFLDNAASNLFRHEGGAWRSFMTADDADTFIREILRSTPPAAGMAQRDKHWGIAQILWATQGSFELPTLASSVVESVQRSVGAQLSAGGMALEHRILEKYAEFYTPARGQLRRSAEAVTLAEERERLEKERSSIEEALGEFETECGRVEELRITLAEAEARNRNIGAELKSARLAAQVYAGLSAERAERLQKVKAAESDYARISEAMAAVGRHRERLCIDGSMLAEIERDVPVSRATLMAEEQTVAELETAFSLAQNHELAATERLRVANLAREYVEASRTATALSGKLNAIDARTAEVQDLEQQRLGMMAPSESELRRFRATAEAHRDAARRLELSRINVTVDPVADVSIEVAEGETPGRADLCSGVQANFAGSPNLTLRIPGFGTLRVLGPVSDYASVRGNRDESAAELSRILERFGTSDEKGLEELYSMALGIEARIREARSTCIALAGNSTSEALRREVACVSQRVAEILRDRPDWAAATPDAGALQAAANSDSRKAQSSRSDTCATLMKAQHRMKDAHGTLRTLIQKQQTLGETIAVCQKELDLLCRDGSDEQRRSALYNAAMDRMAQQEALHQNEKNLEAYPSDPAASISRYEQALEAAILEVQASRDALRDTESRVCQLSERAPYSRFAEICDRLETLESDCRREDTRMAAVALLRATLLDRKSALLQAVSLPVEERATSYLARICGKPLASIRMTRDFAAHTVVPAELQTSQETVQVERLSGGEKEQIHLCTRLALAEELMRDEAHFLLLDDVLTASDSPRLQRVCEMLTEFAKKMQIILFTCHPERFAGIENATLIDVEALRLHPGLAGSGT